MEQKILPVFQVVFAIILILFIKVYLPVFSYQLPLTFPISVFFIIVSVSIALTAVYSFKKHNTTVNPTKPEKTSMIVNTGIYRYSRNPMYLAMAIFIFSIALFSENSLAFSPVLLFIWFISKYQITPEEEALSSRFGDIYVQYLLDVRRWI